MFDFGKWCYCLPASIIFGEGQIKQAGVEVKKFGRKAFLVTGTGSMKRLGVTDRVRKNLIEEGIDVTLYDAVESNPSTQTIDRGADMLRDKCCDVIVALGGGSAIDTAKAISVIAVYGGRIWDYVGKKIPGQCLPLISIPTTAGTGSEVTPWAVFTNNDMKWKAGIGSIDTIPRVAIIDPELMALMPRDLTAASGMDALTHAVEAYTSNITNYVADQLALQSIELVVRYLVRAVKNGNDMEARSGMALASTLGGMALTHTGVGAAHAMGMTIGGFFNTNHGVTVGLLLPSVIEYNIQACKDKYTRISEIFMKYSELDCHALRASNDTSCLPDIISLLISDIGMSSRLREIGVAEDSIPDMVDDTMVHQKDDLDTNPVMPTREDIERIYKKAF